MTAPSDRMATIVADGFAFPEGPRWHDGRLWFSDQHACRVHTLAPDGAIETVAEVAGQPSGLGWLPDGRLLVVSMRDRRLLRREPDGTLVTHADLAGLAPSQCNDMVVAADGRAYVGNFGFDIYEREQPTDTCLIAVDPDGAARVAADGLGFPNGSVITPDGGTLLVGESMAARISAFRIAADGTLSDRQTWADLPAGESVDGMCLDADGAIWAASPGTGWCLRIHEGGAVSERVRGSHTGTYACMLGGADRRTLYLCTAPSHVPAKTLAARQGRIEALEVAVPGAGRP